MKLLMGTVKVVDLNDPSHWFSEMAITPIYAVSPWTIISDIWDILKMTYMRVLPFHDIICFITLVAVHDHLKLVSDDTRTCVNNMSYKHNNN